MRRRAMMQLAAERQERERQAGVNTVSGWVEIIDSNINKNNNDRSLEAYINTSDDIQSRQTIVLSSPVGLVINSGVLYINMYGLWVSCCGVAANTKYQLVVSFRHVERKAKVYVNGAYINEVERANVAPAYYNFYAIGNDISIYNLNNNFRGRINFCRLFNYALSAPEVAALYNAGRPEERVLPGYMKVDKQLDYAAIDWLKGLQLPNPGLVVTNVNNTTASFVGKRTDTGNNIIIFDARDVTFPNRGGVFRIVISIADNGTDDNNYTYTKCIFRKKDGSNVVFDPNRKLIPGENVFYFDVGEQVIDTGIWNYIDYDASKRLDVTIDIRVYAQGCIAEYLPQNIVTDSETGVVAAWLDSARQLPLNDAYLPPLLQSIGGYDLAAHGTPEVVMKPVLRRAIDVDPMWASDIYASLAWDSDQTDAADRREGGKMVANCGSTYKYSRPMLYVTGANFELGKKYAARLTYTLISGSVRIAAFGNWSDGAVEQVQQTFDTQLKQYEYTTPMLSYKMEQPTFNRLYFYLGNAGPDSQFTIDRITIYEYE